MDKVFNLFYYLQLTKGILVYEVNYPANAETYLIELKKLIDFETLTPDGIVKLIDPDTSFQEVMDTLINTAKN